jgi:hypothetical protein
MYYQIITTYDLFSRDHQHSHYAWPKNQVIGSVQAINQHYPRDNPFYL